MHAVALDVAAVTPALPWYPAAHAVHVALDTALVALLYVPARQAVAEKEPGAQKWPGGHGWGMPLLQEKVVGQGAQVSSLTRGAGASLTYTLPSPRRVTAQAARVAASR